MNVAADFGFGYLKAQANNKEVIFPTTWGDYQQSSFRLLSGSNGHDIQTKDGKWLFGESALEQSSLASRSQDSEWIFTSEYLAGMLVAISECYSHRTDPIVDLVTGLPYADYSRGESFLKEFSKHLKGKHEIKRAFGKQTIDIRSVLVIPQNFGPIFRHLLNENGGIHKPEINGSVLLIGSINVGSYTVELGTCKVVFGKSIGINPTEGQSISKKAGIYSLLPTILPLLRNQFQGEEFSDHKILKALETGHIGLYNKTYPVEGVEQPLNQFKRKIHNLATQNWADTMPVKLNDLFALIVTGGGANLTASYLKEIGYHPNIVVSSRPQWDTVEGYGRLKKLLDKRK